MTGPTELYVRLLLASPSPTPSPEDLGGQKQGKIAFGLLALTVLLMLVGWARNRRRSGE